MEIETTSVWNKKPNDLTMGDQVKVGATVVAAGVLIVAVLSIGGTLVERYQARKAAKVQEITPEEGE